MKSGQLDYVKTGGMLAVVLGLFLLISCSSKPEDLCLGKWSTDNGGAKLELFKDGTITIAEKGVSTEKYLLVSGKYSFLDKDRIKIELDGYNHMGDPPIITVAISGDEMTWTYPNGEILKYKRGN